MKKIKNLIMKFKTILILLFLLFITHIFITNYIEQEHEHFQNSIKKRMETYVVSKSQDGYDFSPPFVRYSEIAPLLENASKICPILNSPMGKINITPEFITNIEIKMKNKDFFSDKEHFFLRRLFYFYKKIDEFNLINSNKFFPPRLEHEIKILIDEGFLIDSNDIKNNLDTNMKNDIPLTIYDKKWGKNRTNEQEGNAFNINIVIH